MRYDTARWVLGKCLEYQESNEDWEALPRFRLKGWNVKLSELAQGDRLLVPRYSHKDLMKFIKILWFFLKPEHEERDGTLHQVLKFVSVAHEACSTSFLINGFAFDVVWTLNPSLEHEIKVMLLFLFPFPLLSHIISLPPPCLSHFHSLFLLFSALLLSSLSYGGLTWLKARRGSFLLLLLSRLSSSMASLLSPPLRLSLVFLPILLSSSTPPVPPRPCSKTVVADVYAKDVPG